MTKGINIAQEHSMLSKSMNFSTKEQKSNMGIGKRIKKKIVQI